MAHFGMIGLGTMGRNMVLNLADHGFEVCGYDPNENQRQRLEEEAAGKGLGRHRRPAAKTLKGVALETGNEDHV